VAELQRFGQKKAIPEHGRWRLRDVQKHVELYDIYQSLSIKINRAWRRVFFIEPYNNFDIT